jgi:oligopeptidase A
VRFTPEIDAAVSEATGPLSALYTSIALNDGLYRALREYAASDEAKALTGPRRRYLDRTLEDFRRRGADLPPEGKAELQALAGELANLANTFTRQVLESTAAWSLDLDAEPTGLPAWATGMMRAAAESAGVPGWRVLLQAPVVTAVLMHAEDRDLRRAVWHAWNHRAAAAPHDNGPVLRRMLEIRGAQARLLGFADFADFVLGDRMAGSGSHASAFVESVEARVRSAFQADNADLQSFAASRGAPTPLAPWDVTYWAERLRHARYALDDEELRPYFPFDRVRDGLFGIVEQLFGVTIRSVDIPTWHADVRTFEIIDADGAVLGSFHTDFFPRPDKRDGAWMNALITGKPGTDRAHVGLICGNFTPPNPDRPALLTHREVETLFHEMGHLLHHLFTAAELRSQAGTNVAWDFVELPSQIMENWCWERAALARISGHWQTGEPLPEALFERMTAARNFRAASFIMRQLGFCRVDLDLHRVWTPDHGEPVAFARGIAAPYAPAPLPDDFAMITAFGHLFSDSVGYAAGYYSYQWAAVLDADAFGRFQAEGLFNPATGAAFRRTILASGDSVDPAELFRAFVGRDPDPDAMLRRASLAV